VIVLTLDHGELNMLDVLTRGQKRFIERESADWSNHVLNLATLGLVVSPDEGKTYLISHLGYLVREFALRTSEGAWLKIDLKSSFPESDDSSSSF